MHKGNHAHVHIRNHGHVTVRIATEEEIKKGVRYIDNDDEHGHSHEHAHEHHHNPEHTKKILNRFSRAIGHMEHVKKMVENEVDCSEVLIQLAAVKSAVNNIGRELLKEHVTHCIIESADNGDEQAIDMLNTALDQFMK
ncbi:MAG: metal-sensing transcriptional repressor [Clostridiales bacterium]|nr:metal-sensing transcriptional repressor [Clostridiales bacterium]MBS5878155.1 metal-sensing transcriptional repressor [Clostridiales bacterium]